jgi:hypothetical protein
MTILPKETREKFIRKNWLRPSVVCIVCCWESTLSVFLLPFLICAQLQYPLAVKLYLSKQEKNILSCNNLLDAQHTTTVYSPELKGGVVKMLASRIYFSKLHTSLKSNRPTWNHFPFFLYHIHPVKKVDSTIESDVDSRSILINHVSLLLLSSLLRVNIEF